MRQNEASELERMSRLLAMVAIKGVEEGEAIRMLSRAGYSYPEIGELIGKTANAVEVRLRRLRRTSGKKTGRSSKAPSGK
jgi:DNA-directed RNA polymerase specialized sigma24 family protein